LVRLFSNAGSNVIAIDRRPDALEMAVRMGAAGTIVLEESWKVVERVRQLTGGAMSQLVVEATGKQRPLDVATELTSEMGHLVIAGYHQDGLRQVNLQQWNWRGLEVTNAHERQPEVYRR